MWGENIQRVNVENEVTILAQVNVTLETEKGVQLNQTCNNINGAERYILATGDCKRTLPA